VLHLYLVRHGLTLWNSEGRIQGHTDVPLSEEGRAQALRLASRLAAVPLCAVWSSDLSRARETAEIIAARRSLPVTTTPLLRESCLGAWEGLTEAEIVARGDGRLLEAFRRDSTLHRPPGGEPMRQVWERILDAQARLRAAHAEGAVVVVGHGGSLKALLCDAMGAGIAAMRRLWLDNASLSLIEHRAGRTWVRLVNDTCHLDAGAAGTGGAADDLAVVDPNSAV